MKTIGSKNMQVFTLVAAFLVLFLMGIPSVAISSDCCNDCPGTGTPGYWKNHPDAWPVEEITIGGITYSKYDAIALIDTPESGDKTYTLFRALVAAKLNVLVNPCCSCCIRGIVVKADKWMEEYPVGSGVRGNSDAWQIGGECLCPGERLYLALDNYNNGFACAPSRDDLE